MRWLKRFVRELLATAFGQGVLGSVDFVTLCHVSLRVEPDGGFLAGAARPSVRRAGEGVWLVDCAP